MTTTALIWRDGKPARVSPDNATRVELAGGIANLEGLIRSKLGDLATEEAVADIANDLHHEAFKFDGRGRFGQWAAQRAAFRAKDHLRRHLREQAPIELHKDIPAPEPEDPREFSSTEVALKAINIDPEEQIPLLKLPDVIYWEKQLHEGWTDEQMCRYIESENPGVNMSVSTWRRRCDEVRDILQKAQAGWTASAYGDAPMIPPEGA